MCKAPSSTTLNFSLAAGDEIHLSSGAIGVKVQVVRNGNLMLLPYTTDTMRDHIYVLDVWDLVRALNRIGFENQDEFIIEPELPGQYSKLIVRNKKQSTE